jgi:hypothetical protein
MRQETKELSIQTQEKSNQAMKKRKRKCFASRPRDPKKGW